MLVIRFGLRDSFFGVHRLNANVAAPNASALFDEAARFAAAGDYVSALNRTLKILAQDRSRVEVWHLLARLQLQLGLHSEAVQAATMASQMAPNWADCRYILGRVLKANGRTEDAIEQYRAAIRLDAKRPHYFCSLGVAFRELGRLEESILSYQAALALEPANKEASNNLANVLRQTGRDQEATCHDNAKLALNQELDRLVNDAWLLYTKGEYQMALVRWTDVLRLAPDSVVALHNQAATLYALQLFDEAMRHEERALALEPEHLHALDTICRIAMFGGEVEKVVHYGERLYKLHPSDAIKIKTRLTMPVVQESLASIAQTRQRFEATVDELTQTPLKVGAPNENLGALSFYLAYHGESNRRIQEKLGGLMIHACPGITWEAPHCRGYRRHAGRLRVGFASELLRNHSIGKTSSGLMAQLDRERFEVFGLNLPGSSKGDDPMRQFMRGRCDHWLSFEGSLEQVRNAVAELKLDILFYQDIGMTPFSYFLAYARLAPLQCVSYGHPDTTGIPNLDYFISQDLYEPVDGGQHYTERLFLLQNLPTLAYYYRPEEPNAPFDRTNLGFNASDHLYVCAQTLFKLHPEFDELLAGILERDARARIVLIEGQYKGWTERLRSRFAARMGDLAQRITFIGRRDGAQYLTLLRAADVALDTIHFNGMNSSLEALAMGTPVVTWPKDLQRGRHTQAMYRRMELTDCIAHNAQDYIDIAVRIGTEPDYRESLRRAILERNAVLFENRQVVTEFERFFETALEASGTQV